MKQELESKKMVTVLKVMDRVKVADAVHSVLDAGVDMLGKKSLDKDDYGKLKVIRTMAPVISSGVAMIQQETAQQRNTLIAERMKQIGYGEGTKQIAG